MLWKYMANKIFLFGWVRVLEQSRTFWTQIRYIVGKRSAYFLHFLSQQLSRKFLGAGSRLPLNSVGQVVWKVAEMLHDWNSPTMSCLKAAVGKQYKKKRCANSSRELKDWKELTKLILENIKDKGKRDSRVMETKRVEKPWREVPSPKVHQKEEALRSTHCAGFSQPKEQKHQTDRSKSQFLLYTLKHKGHCKMKLSTSQ